MRTLSYARERLVVVLVQDVREAPAEFAGGLEEDFTRSSHEMIERTSADRDGKALSALGPAPVERQTQAFLQAARLAIAADFDAWR